MFTEAPNSRQSQTHAPQLSSSQPQPRVQIHVVHDNSVDIANLKLEINTLQNKTEAQEEKINELKKKNETNKNTIMGVAAGLIGTILLAVIKLVAGVL